MYDFSDKISVLAPMNFDYSYRAFLITSLLFGILFLGMYSIKLSRYTEVAEKEFNVEYALEDLPIEEEEALAKNTAERVNVETNRAYNEAEKFISELEDSREEPTESTEAKLQAMNEAIDNVTGDGNAAAIKEAKKKIEETKATLAKTSKKTLRSSSSANRKTTISYSLVNRKAMALPNPVYTCDGFGKVVISIEVNQLGKVVRTDYNKSASTTTNECLIDSALEYAREARFTTDGAKTSQLGTISYHFPGQY
ncbi:MAG: energy transducer TonB [Altibacter sp.]|uniref:energy transducer TonB n=1 Tax=Altibacter sp. TaxID=2024823 RepID=UPI001DD24B08|nr:energy transducer TonB [Altibacter sp.]MBZ0327579.1 energy transducer TonB [Altibacter sp.]